MTSYPNLASALYGATETMTDCCSCGLREVSMLYYLENEHRDFVVFQCCICKKYFIELANVFGGKCYADVTKESGSFRNMFK